VQNIEATVPEIGWCPDERCGESQVTGVVHPKDESGRKNRCPTCLTTLTPARHRHVARAQKRMSKRPPHLRRKKSDDQP
jgi:hypothetical protein